MQGEEHKMDREIWIYVALTFSILAFVGFETFGGREWWTERKFRKAPYWKKYFEDIDIYRDVVVKTEDTLLAGMLGLQIQSLILRR